MIVVLMTKFTGLTQRIGVTMPFDNPQSARGRANAFFK
jgi:hypothetical protein